MAERNENIISAPAKVLGCLRPGKITILLGAGLGQANFGIPTEIDANLIPLDLRMPNSEFVVRLDKTGASILGIDRLTRH